ncbi:hypothetical protein PIB30_034793 [Stylosanthes scabra]|uniref:Uncharacterized protein n=1 Tax=Stylosanthes scabra TaxID=79078 RepID=A0ABU6SD47_9FABA|nr:hypothetical protein [Stylosanthes scabra]
MKRNEGVTLLETPPIDIEGEVIEKKLGGQRACDSFGISKDVESKGEWVSETVGEKGSLKLNERYSDIGELEWRTVARSARLKNKKNQSRKLVENYDTKEFYDDEDFMSILKELNETQDLERKQMKQREKAKKSRPKMSKIRGS